MNSLISDELQIIDGDKVIEVVSGQYNKGKAVSEIIGAKKYDFIMCFGDDVSDEFMFNDLTTHNINVKVGKKNTSALSCVENTRAVRSFLNDLIS